jgi:hypothetical protein
LVEITGNATQDNGAIATFYSIQQIPANNEKKVTLPVKAAAGPGTFVKGLAITVVARASTPWVNMLVAATDSEDPNKFGSRFNSASSAAGWTLNHYDSALYLPDSQPQPDPPPATDPPNPPEPQSQPAPQSLSVAPGALARHGTWWDRRKAERPDLVMEGRFTRLFPYLPAARFKHADLVQLADNMIAPEDTDPAPEPDPEENPGIPAAYTYLGQFADHDLTFDPVSHLREKLTRAQLRRLVDFRTPRFDLDNLYGRGPDDQPYMYEADGIHLLLGERLPG